MNDNIILKNNLAEACESLKLLEDIASYELKSINLQEAIRRIRQNLEIAETKNLNIAEEINDINFINLVHDNSRKAAQALKAINEFAALNNLAELAAFAEQSRIDIKNLEKVFYEQFGTHELKSRLEKARLYFVTGRAENEPFESLIYKAKLALSGGADIVQLREKGLEASQTCFLANQIKELCHKANALFIVNDRPDIALATDADGVHIGQEDLDINLVRRIIGKNKIIGLSTHSIDEIKAGIESEADYLSVGPVYSTPTKSGRPPVGLELIAWAKENIQNKPWFAVGGINDSNLVKVLESGAQRFAFVKYLMDSPDQAQTISLIRNRLEAVRVKA